MKNPLEFHPELGIARCVSWFHVPSGQSRTFTAQLNLEPHKPPSQFGYSALIPVSPSCLAPLTNAISYLFGNRPTTQQEYQSCH